MEQTIYICAPFSALTDEEFVQNVAKVKTYCRDIVNLGFLPIAPQLYLPQFMDENKEREAAMKKCLLFIDLCDAVWVYGDKISSGMKQEIEYANYKNKPIRFVIRSGANT